MCQNSLQVIHLKKSVHVSDSMTYGSGQAATEVKGNRRTADNPGKAWNKPRWKVVVSLAFETWEVMPLVSNHDTIFTR